MLAGQFIDRLEQQGLLDRKVVEELRRKLAGPKGNKLTAEAIAKYLIDAGYLTNFQAARLFSDQSRSVPDAPVETTGAAPAEPLNAAEDLLDSRDASGSAGAATKPTTSSGPHRFSSLPAKGEASIVPSTAPSRFAAESPAADAPATAAPKRAVRDVDEIRRAALSREYVPRTSEWHTRLFIGGAILLGVVLIVGAYLYFALSQKAAEKLWNEAEIAYQEQRYAEALSMYDEFVGSHSRHANAGLAHVRREMTLLLQSYKDPERGMQVALDILPRIKDEETFGEAHEELANALTQIAAGFVKQAMGAPETVGQEQFLKKTEDAMALVDNPEYVPAVFRKSQATAIESITEDMARVRRRIGRVKTLQATIDAIQAAVTSGNLAAASAARDALRRQYAGLDSDPQLVAAMRKVSDKQREFVAVVEKLLSPQADPGNATVSPHALLSNRTGQPIPELAGQTVYTLAGGSVFALDASTGAVLWRRFVGLETTIPPRPVAPDPGADAIAIDQRSHELLRLEAKSGKPVWRLALGEPFFTPAVAANHLFVAGVSGKLYAIDPRTGQAARGVQLPQTVETGTFCDPQQPWIYQIADQDNIYVLSAENLECREVFYLGHQRGTVRVPPVMILGHLLVVENSGPDYSYLHVIATDGQGLHLNSVQEKVRLDGHVLETPASGPRSLLVATDRHAVSLFDVVPGTAAGTPAIVRSAQIAATAEAPVISYSLLHGDYAWVAGTRLAKYKSQAAEGKFLVEWAREEPFVYTAPLQIVGDVVISTRQRQDSSGVTVAATRNDGQDPVWQTDIAVPALGLFVQGDNVDAVTVRGALFRLGAADFQSGIPRQATSIAATDDRQVPPLTDAVACGNGQWVLAPSRNYHQLVTYQPGNSGSVVQLQSLPVPNESATAPPVPMAGSLLVPLKDGSVAVVNPFGGSDRIHAFHPSIPVGAPTLWSQPAVVDGGQEFIISNSQDMVYRVGIVDASERTLTAIHERPLKGGHVTGPWVALGDAGISVLRSGAVDLLVTVPFADFNSVHELPLTGRLQWGPQRVGDAVVLATESTLMCFDGAPQQRWTLPLECGAILGRALAAESRMWLSTENGSLLQVDLAVGNVLAKLDVGEPLSSGPVAFGNQLLVAGRSGTVFTMVVPPQ